MFKLTHLHLVPHICTVNWVSIGSDNGLSPGRCQAIIWTNAGLLLIGPIDPNYTWVLAILADSLLFSVNNISAGLWLNCISSVEISFFWLTYYCSIGPCFCVRVYLSLFRSTCKLIQSFSPMICQINGALTFFVYYFNCFYTPVWKTGRIMQG